MSIRPLSPALQAIAAKEINEVPSRIQEDLQHIKEWIAKQPHLKARTDDQWLLAFLRGSKHSLQRTKDKLDVFYTLKSVAPEFFASRDPFLPEIQEFLRAGFVIPLKKTINSTGATVTITRAKGVNPEIITPLVAARAINLLLDMLCVNNDNFAISGVHIISDLKDIPYKFVLSLTPVMLKQWVALYQNGYPMRVKSMHFINIPSAMEPIVQLIKKLLSAKLASRLYFYTSGNIEGLYKFVPASILPKEYGGDGDSIEDLIAETKAAVESQRDWFKEDEKYRSDETKRPGKPVTYEKLFGVEGSFRKLQID